MISIRILGGILFLIFLAPQQLMGYVPPIKQIMDEIYSHRKPHPTVEAVIKHNIQVAGGEVVQLDEQIVTEQNGTYVVWNFSELAPFAVRWIRQSYNLASRQVYESRSTVILKYILSSSPNVLLEQIIQEHFVKREQVDLFKPNYVPRGDPATWKTSSHYNAQPGVFLHRLNKRIVIAVVGLDEPPIKKAIYFDESMRGLVRLEWIEGQSVTTWDFSLFSQYAVPGQYPKQMTLTVGGMERVSSRLVSLRSLKPKELSDFKDRFNSLKAPGALPEYVDKAIRILTGFR